MVIFFFVIYQILIAPEMIGFVVDVVKVSFKPCDSLRAEDREIIKKD